MIVLAFLILCWLLGGCWLLYEDVKDHAEHHTLLEELWEDDPRPSLEAVLATASEETF
jgi:hypothetical protein